MTAVLDHLAIGTPVLTDGWELFGGVLGGAWAYGGDSPGYWWGQLEFAAGPKIELLTPTGGPGAAFLDRFLAARGAGPHHCNLAHPSWGGCVRPPAWPSGHRHPGASAGRFAASLAPGGAAGAGPAGPLRPDRASRQ